LIARLLALLRDPLGKPPLIATVDQVDRAYLDTLDHVWKQRHRPWNWALLTLQACGIALMGLHGVAFTNGFMRLGIGMVVAGVAANLVSLFYFGAKVKP
jgi:hypothetical protein